MRLTLACAALLLTLPVAARAQDAHAGHAAEAMQQPPASPAPKNPKLPAAEDQAKAALNASPRHGEYIDVPVTGSTPVRTWIVYPERKDKAPVVIVIHEIFGLSDWIRGVADQLASEGFIAVAPDLISGHGAQRRRHRFGRDARRRREARARADAGGSRRAAERRPRLGDRASGRQRKERNRRVLLGRRHELPATRRRSPALNAAVVYYGTAPDASDARRRCRRRSWGSTAATTLGSRPRWRRPTPR